MGRGDLDMDSEGGAVATETLRTDAKTVDRPAELGLEDLGSLIHCSRDHAMVAGFNDDLELTRRQTIMEGGSCCDFRFRRKNR